MSLHPSAYHGYPALVHCKKLPGAKLAGQQSGISSVLASRELVSVILGQYCLMLLLCCFKVDFYSGQTACGCGIKCNWTMKSLKGTSLSLTLITWLALGIAAAPAQVPGILNYQGRLSAGGTNVFNGLGQFKFALVNGGTNVSRQATAVPTVSGGFLTEINVVDGGAGYAEAPAVTIIDSTGSNATARSTLTGDMVSTIAVINPGRRYSSSPNVIIAPPVPNELYATFWSNDGSSSGGNQPTLAVPLVVNQGSFSINLGDTSISNMLSEIQPNIFTNNNVRLRIWFSDGVTGFQQFYPDQRLTAVGYAMVAATLPDASVTTSKLAPGAVGTNAIAASAISSGNLALDNTSLGKVSGGVMTSSSGQIGIGTSSPSAALDVVGTIKGTMLQGNGAVPWLVVTNIQQQCLPNTGYLANNAAQVSLTLPPAPAVGDIIRVAGMGAGGWRIVGNSGQSLPAGTNGFTCETNWVAHGSSGAWDGAASSADGHVLVAVAVDLGVYVSTDYGNTWNARMSRAAFGAASSADGSKLVVTAIDGQIYTSTDSGANWTARDSSRGWHDVASSADGSKLVAVVGGGQIYTSTDSGTNWIARDSARQWYGVASSTDGTKLVATVWGGQIYTSTDSGITWFPRESVRNWRGVGSSADGSKLVAVDYGGFIYTSVNFGTNWIARENSRNWYAAACSGDGNRLVGVVYGGQTYLSADAGNTWTPSGNTVSWYACAFSTDGQRILSVAAGDHIYTTGCSPMSPLLGNKDAAIELQYIDNGIFRILSREGTISY